MRSTINSLKLIALALVLGLGVNYALAWTGPTSAPPRDNTAAPINVSATAQVKNGGLSVNAFSAFLNAYFAGNVGIGTRAPTQKLDVVGTIKTTGLQIPTGAGAGKVLTSDATGLASWQTGGGGGFGQNNCRWLEPAACFNSGFNFQCAVGEYAAGLRTVSGRCSGSDNNFRVQLKCCRP